MDRDTDEQLIWKFLDGDLTRSEADRIEEKLELEEAFRKQMADMRDLDELLAERTADLPSMRFTTNVMESVLRRAVSAANYFQLSRKFVKWYFGAIACMLIAVIAIGANSSSPGALSEGSERISQVVSTFTSHPSLMILFQVSIGFAGLIMLDFFLRRRFQPVK